MIKCKGQAVDNITAKYAIISSVSLNNTPSRALDILIASNEYKRIGFLVSDHIEPAVGYLSKNIQGGSLGLPGQVYAKDDVLIFQMRSNIRIGRKKQFVQQLANLLNRLGITSILIIGSLPFKLRPDLEIQSLSKNVYYYCKSQNQQIKKAQQNGLLKPISLLIDSDEEATDILGQSGFIKNVIKSQKFPKADYLCVFSQTLLDHPAAIKLAKIVSLISGKKELAKVEQSILSD